MRWQTAPRSCRQRIYLHDLDPDLPASPFDPPTGVSETSRDAEMTNPRSGLLDQAENPDPPRVGETAAARS